MKLTICFFLWIKLCAMLNFPITLKKCFKINVLQIPQLRICHSASCMISLWANMNYFMSRELTRNTRIWILVYNELSCIVLVWNWDKMLVRASLLKEVLSLRSRPVDIEFKRFSVLPLKLIGLFSPGVSAMSRAVLWTSDRAEICSGVTAAACS